MLVSYGYVMHLKAQFRPVDVTDNRLITVEIPPGTSAAAIAEILEEAGLVRSSNAFLSYCKQNNLDTSLKAGIYTLSPSQSIQTIAEIIIRGPDTQVRITIPEGYTVEQIGQLLVAREIVTELSWRDALNLPYPDFPFLPPSAAQGSRLEGYLFPDTYFLSSFSTASQVVEMMLRRFQDIWENEGLAEDLAQSGMTRHEIVTIASMIEREAMLIREMPRIAGVIYNRLAINMLLQIDATIIFALQEHREVVLWRDLEVDSPYNTYRNLGLPPGPIANPGLAALRAALNPEDHQYLYYVAVGDGSHEFNRTFDRHLEAQRRFESRNR
jgi:UPF0755 protein